MEVTTSTTTPTLALSEGSSSPLSILSRSPSPFQPYKRPYLSPSLSSSELSSLGSTPSPESSMILGMSTPPSTQHSDDDGASSKEPPKKRRRITKEKKEDEEDEEGPQHLDLSGMKVFPDEQDSLAKLLKVLHKRRKIVVVAGAGISVSAGIPDFRSSTGLFKSLKREHNLKSSGKDLFDAAVYKDGDSTTSFHAMIRNLSTATKTAEATPFHHLLATLAQEGRLLRLYTQNVDGIDTSLPPLATQIPLPKKGPWPKTVQLHGTLEHMTCTKCSRISDFEPELFDGPSPPPCSHCESIDDLRTSIAGKRSHGVGVLRPRMVLYNEHNPDDEAIGSVVKADMRTRPDALIVVGTTLKVPGVKRIVKEMTQIVRDRRDGVTIWINNDPPPALKDYDWDLVVRGPCDHVAAHAGMRRWDQPEPELCLVSEDEVERIKQRAGTPKVVIQSPSKNKTVVRVAGLSTPVASPKMKPLLKANDIAPIKAPKLGVAKKQTQSTLGGTKRKADDSNALPKNGPVKKTIKAPKKKATAKNKPPGPKPQGLKALLPVSKNIAAANIKGTKPKSPIKIKADTPPLPLEGLKSTQMMPSAPTTNVYPGPPPPPPRTLPLPKSKTSLASSILASVPHTSPSDPLHISRQLAAMPPQPRNEHTVMQPVSPLSARTNQSPPYSPSHHGAPPYSPITPAGGKTLPPPMSSPAPPWSPITPLKSLGTDRKTTYRDVRKSYGELTSPSPSSVVPRPVNINVGAAKERKETPEERRRTISPGAHVPRGMSMLID